MYIQNEESNYEYRSKGRSRKKFHGALEDGLPKESDTYRCIVKNRPYILIQNYGQRNAHLVFLRRRDILHLRQENEAKPKEIYEGKLSYRIEDFHKYGIVVAYPSMKPYEDYAKIIRYLSDIDDAY